MNDLVIASHQSASFPKTQAICDYSANPPAGCVGFGPGEVPTDGETGGEPFNCGLFGLALFCPFTFGGVIGRLFRALFGGA